MSNYPEPDNFDEIYVQRNESLTWDVIGRSIDFRGNVKFKVIIGNFENKVLAETFIKVYTEEYIKSNFFNTAGDF